MIKNKFTIELDTTELMKQLIEFSDAAPRKALAKGVRKGMTKILRTAKADAPVADGTLQKALRTVTEKKNTKKMKVVMQINYDPAYNSKLQKIAKNPGKYGGVSGTGGLYYYPASMEFGYKTAKGQETGHFFLRYARDTNDESFAQSVLDALQTELDRVWGSST